MSARDSDAELAAIEQLISALDPLEAEARQRVIGYVFQRLGLSTPAAAGGPPLPGGALPLSASAAMPAAARSHVTDIRTFAVEKAPNSKIERAAVVAFYLSELAPEGERKPDITGADLTKYSKQAGLPAPSNTRGTLFAAKRAGYFDTAGHGKYKLNAVGYNLVAHNLPGSGAASGAAPRRPAPKRRPGPRKASKRRSR